MRRRLVILVLCLLCLAPVATAAQARDPVRVAESGTGTIAGTVVTDKTVPQPVRRAMVTLKGGPGGDRSTTTTDDGRFTFTALPAGRYRVTAAKAAYLETTYGATKPGGSGATIAITSDEHVELTLQLAYGAILAGTITNVAHEPVPSVFVTALRVRPGGDLERAAGNVTTDDRGMYRVFGLPPGDYVLEATMPFLSLGSHIEQPSAGEIDAVLSRLAQRASASAPGVPVTRPSTPSIAPPASVVFAPVYFAGVPLRQEATRVTVNAGEERTGLDFWFAPVATATIAGSISGPIQDLTAVQVSLQASGQGATVRTVQPNADGTFVFSGVPPGRYSLVGRANPSRTPAPPPMTRTFSTGAAEAARTFGAEWLYATTEVETRGSDVAGVALLLQPGATLSGRLQFDATRVMPPKRLTQIRVSVSPIGAGGPPVGVVGSGFTMLREASVRADGIFTITGIGPGVYSFRARLPPDISRSGWWPRSAIFENRDLLDIEAVMTPGLDLSNVVVTFSNRHTHLSGVLYTSSGQPASDAVIVVFSTDPQSWRALARRTQAVRSDNAGHFEVHDLPPGEYFMAAVTDIDPDDLTTPAFFERLVPAAIRVTLNEGEQRIQDLRIARE